MAEREKESVADALRKHVKALTLDIGPRTPFTGESLARAAVYIRSAFEDAGLYVKEQAYQYCGQRVFNLIATPPATTEASAYYVVGAHYDTVPMTPGADDNASAVAVMLELARRLPETKLKAPVLFAAFTLEEPPAFMTGHQGSRVFVRDCESRGDSVLGALILEIGRLHFAPPALPICGSLGRLPGPRRLHRYSRQLAFASVRACSSEGVPYQ